MTAPNNERVSVEAAISRNRATYDLVIDSLRPVFFKNNKMVRLITNTKGKIVNFAPIPFADTVVWRLAGYCLATFSLFAPEACCRNLTAVVSATVTRTRDSLMEYFNRHQRARKPSFQPIFLPYS